MQPVVVPKLTVRYSVELELEYDAFSGRTEDEMADLIQDKMHDLLFEVDPRVVGVYTTITSIDSND
jgi:hypothetical protein